MDCFGLIFLYFIINFKLQVDKLLWINYNKALFFTALETCFLKEQNRYEYGKWEVVQN